MGVLPKRLRAFGSAPNSMSKSTMASASCLTAHLNKEDQMHLRPIFLASRATSARFVFLCVRGTHMERRVATIIGHVGISSQFE